MPLLNTNQAFNCSPQVYREMIIRKPKVNRLPQLELNGKWLTEAGFTVGTSVSVYFVDSCLVLSTDTNIKNIHSVIMVQNKYVRSKLRSPQARPQLIINGFTLKSYGLHEVNCRVGLVVTNGMIQLSKINRTTTLTTAGLINEERDCFD